jgi:hypothetical protein
MERITNEVIKKQVDIQYNIIGKHFKKATCILWSCEKNGRKERLPNKMFR